jgi:hypothetical protein
VACFYSATLAWNPTAVDNGASLNPWLHNHRDDALGADVDFDRDDVVSTSQPANDPLATESVALVEDGPRRAIHGQLSGAGLRWQSLAACNLDFWHGLAPWSPQPSSSLFSLCSFSVMHAIPGRQTTHRAARQAPRSEANIGNQDRQMIALLRRKGIVSNNILPERIRQK